MTFDWRSTLCRLFGHNEIPTTLAEWQKLGANWYCYRCKYYLGYGELTKVLMRIGERQERISCN